MRQEHQRLQQNPPHVIVGTPGRVYDMMNRQAIDPNTIRMFVLDEADEMLSRGFMYGGAEVRHQGWNIASPRSVIAKECFGARILILNI